MTVVHLVHGYLAAGKTTFARRLAAEIDGVCLSLDEWYLRLFTGGEPTSHQDYADLDRLWRMLDDHWPQIAARGVNVVLDFGFWSRQSRDRAQALADAVGAEVQLHWVQCDEPVALARLAARNGDPASFVLDEAAYRTLFSRFEQLGDDERPLLHRSDM